MFNIFNKKKYNDYLLRYAFYGDFSTVKYLIEKKGANINCTDVNGYTPLMHAVIGGQVNIISYLISAGANIKFKNQYGETVFDIVDRKGTTAVKRYFTMYILPKTTSQNRPGSKIAK